jgi:outer membrane receptor protein involved in Fe transport
LTKDILFEYSSFAMNNFLILLFFLSNAFINHSLISQEIQKKEFFFLSKFQPLDTEPNPEIEQSIQEELARKINNSKIQVKNSSGGTLEDRIKESKALGGKFLIEGYYSRGKETGNLNLYLAIFDPETKKIIDAYTLDDEVYNLEGLSLDQNELKETDAKRIAKFTNKANLNLKTNPNRKERSENIEQYLTGNSKLGPRLQAYVRSDDRATEEALENVFDLLQSQVTTSTTKTSKKTNEAPNIVSVLSHKQMEDFGRISINDILYQLPGFSPGQINERRTVHARGLYEGWNNNHLLMLVDGVQMNESFYGSALTWEITPLNMIKSLEVIRGPGSALYGSNATNGVVSINTFSGKDLKGTIKTRARIGDYGTKIYDFITGNKGELFSHVLSFNSYETNGNEFSNYDGSGRTDVFGFLQKNSFKDNRSSYYVFSKLEGEGKLKGLSFQFHRQEWNFQTFNGWLQNIPDSSERLKEGRNAFILKYSNPITDKLSQEYVIKYDAHFWDFNAKFYPIGSEDFPSGMQENLKTSVDNIFSRAQVTYSFGNGGSFVGGVEANRISYLGDKFHTSNADLNLLGSNENFPGNLTLPLDPFMDWIKNKPILKFAPFAQVTSGRLFSKMVEFTVGVRYDEISTHFRGIDMPYKDTLGVPNIDIYDPISENVFTRAVPSRLLGPPFVTNEKRTYRRTSPRVGVVLFLSDRLTFKFMGGRAFREPAPGELFGINTYIGGSNNPRSLSPEVIKTIESGLDWAPSSHLNIRLNGFQTRFENVIDYNGTSNAVSNVYTQGQRGIETEVLFQFKYFNGFVNYSRFYRYLDHNLDASISKHPREVVISPASRANIGVSGEWKKFQSSFALERQGMVARKTSDLGEIDPLTGLALENTFSNPYQFPAYRPAKVPAWFNLNLRFSYRFTDYMKIALNVYNATNSTQFLVQRANYPFDYNRDGRRVMLDFQANF